MGSRKNAKRPPPGTTVLPRYLTQDELQRFRQALVKGRSPRDLALFGTMYRYGLRSHEATLLEIHDVDLHRRRIRVRRAKGGDTKEYPITDDLLPVLRRYLSKRRERGPFLFTGRQSSNQQGMTVLRVQQLFKRYAKEAGLPHPVASHSLRHSCAVHALESGFSLEYVADLLGHRSLRSTQVYAKITSPAREQMLQQLAQSRFVVRWS